MKAQDEHIDALERAIAAERALTDQIISELVGACKAAHLILQMCLPESCTAKDRGRTIERLAAAIKRVEGGI